MKVLLKLTQSKNKHQQFILITLDLLPFDIGIIRNLRICSKSAPILG